MKKLKYAFVATLFLVSGASYAQLGDLFKGLEKIAREIEGSTQPQQQSQPQQQNQPQQQSQPQQQNQPQTSTPTLSENEKIADLLLNISVNLWYQQKLFRMQQNQWNFNVKYGAPPISANHKKMIYTDIPNIIKELSNCSVKKANRPINQTIIEKYYMTTDEESIADMRKMDQWMKSMGVDENSPTKVPLKKNLNDAPNAEMELKALVLNRYESMLKYNTNKNWCTDTKW